MAKNPTIVWNYSPDKKYIQYRMQDKRLNLPPYKGIHVDGVRVRMDLSDGTTHHLPSLQEGYTFDHSNKWEIVFKKKENV